ncbi:hypothetical protein ACQRIT_001540 [Beauveria bassiana]
MVSVQTSGEGAPAGQLTQLPPPSTQPPTNDATNPWAATTPNQHSQQHSSDAAELHRKPVPPSALQPGFGSSTPQPPVPQIQHHDDTGLTTASGAKEDDSSDKRPAAPMERIPSILRPGGGKSFSSNPFRNKTGIGAAAALTPAEAMSTMRLDSTTNDPWNSAIYAQPTGATNISQDSRVQQQSVPYSALQPGPWSWARPIGATNVSQDSRVQQQGLWSRHDAVELDATSSLYVHPPESLGVPTPEGQSISGDEAQNIVKSPADPQGNLVKPADEFSHIFDDQHTWNVLGRTPGIQRSATIKTAGEDSDQDDWNIIESEASSIAGDAEGTPASDVHKAKTEVPRPLIPGMGAPAASDMCKVETEVPRPSTSVVSASTVPHTDTPDAPAGPRSSTPFVDALSIPQDEARAEDERKEHKNEVLRDAEIERLGHQATKETKMEINDTPERPPLPPTLHESRNEQNSEELLIEPIGYEPPVKAPQPHHPPQTGGLLPKQQDERPPLPPRQTETTQRWSAWRQPVDGEAETYQIKKIRWNDPAYNNDSRVSPILVQNQNGPCPLVALVNALSLTTPPDIYEITLVHILYSRERICLNLLLDAVLNELMSPRRTSYEDALPDMNELYGFLQSLHTGMNVNPRFIPTPELVEAYRRSSLTNLDPKDRDTLMPGTFENSLEMKLYATFSIPLIHGWLPAKSDPAYDAFERQAATYEDAQNLLFREEELEAKLVDSQSGLSVQEQQLYQDIMAIKMFMIESATQLTPWGIKVISEAMRPGTFAILFRNDHFSTLYCHPITMKLLTLVTDAGYSSHDEVVWEILEDVNGEHSALYSGDFRPVGSPCHGSPSAGPSRGNYDTSSDWTSVQNKRHGKNRQVESDDMSMFYMSPGANHELEDHDLALALQLQEEEEQNQREEQERQRHEAHLSEQVLEPQGRQRSPHMQRAMRRRSSAAARRPPLPSRGSSSNNVNGRRRRSGDAPPPKPPRPQTQNVRPLVPPATATGGRPAVNRPGQAAGEEAPPSYEAAQHDRRYVPGQGRGGGGPAPGGGVGGVGGSHPMQGAPLPGGHAPGHVGNHRPPGFPMGGRLNQGPGRDRSRECGVM